MLMPDWLRVRLEAAFRKKDKKQIKLLNESWAFHLRANK